MTNLPTIRGDGFDTYSDAVHGREEKTGGGRHIFLGFGIDQKWRRSSDKGEMTGAALVAVNLERRAVRREMVDGKARTAEKIVLGAEPFPDVDAWNAALPNHEKIPGFSGQLERPWHTETWVYLMQPETLDRFVWVARMSTSGSAQAVRDLRDKVSWMRQFRGSSVYPVVELSTVHMPTRFGGRDRPHFDIKSWISMGDAGSDGNEAVAALPSPDTPPTQPTAHAVEEKVAKAAKTGKVTNKRSAERSFYGAPKTNVAEPSLGEEMNDRIPI
jgi:hypothetical protein